MTLFIITCNATKSKLPLFKSNPQSNVILVAVMKDTDTVYKKAMLDSLVANYGKQYVIRKKVISSYKDLTGESYKMLIVFDQLKAWLMFNGDLKKIIAQTDATHAIYYMTAGDPKWRWKEKDIHHIASASQNVNIAAGWKELNTKVKQILK